MTIGSIAPFIISSYYFELEQPSTGIEKVDSVEGFKLKLKEHTIRSP